MESTPETVHAVAAIVQLRRAADAVIRETARLRRREDIRDGVLALDGVINSLVDHNVDERRRAALTAADFKR